VSCKATNANLIGLRYAKALLHVQANEQEINQFLEVSALLIQDPLFKRILDIQKTNANFYQSMQEWMKSVTQKLGLFPKVKNFLILIVVKNRLGYLQAISNSLKELINIKAGREIVNLKLFEPASDIEIEDIKNNIKRILKIEPILNVIIDSSIMGGFIIQTKSVIIDNSLKNRIKKIHNVMKGVA
jgi:F-type H+-transporting ATPase subunit delta